MSSGAWVRTAADALTAVAGAAGAGVAGIWTYVRYLRQAPDVPRANASVTASIAPRSGSDFVVVEARFTQQSGSNLTIRRDEHKKPPKPLVELTRLAAEGSDGALQTTHVCTVEIFRDETELGSGESARDHRVIPVGPRNEHTIGYEVTLHVTAGTKDGGWTWSTNAIVQVDNPTPAVGTTVSATPTK